MDYKVPACAYIKKSIQKGHNLLLPNYVGYIGWKPVYEVEGPLESMDDILICTERGVREVTTKEWGKPLREIGGGLYKNPAYISGLSWGTHLLPL
jgi:hypothetical protein